MPAFLMSGYVKITATFYDNTAKQAHSPYKLNKKTSKSFQEFITSSRKKMKVFTSSSSKFI